jgi:outer membrane receptor for ferrienterochelin and colicin
LDDLFKNTPVSYQIRGSQLILVKKKKNIYFSISGTITDKQSGESLIGANIYNPDNFQGSVSNNYGFYLVNLKPGKVRLVCSYIGYHPFILEFDGTKDTVIDIELNPNLSSIKEVVVMDKSPQQTVQNSQMSTIDLNVADIKSAPVLLGETDVLKTLQTMPGVQGGTEGSSGFYVRGGSPDQNLILLDGVPVYNVNHLFGFLSVFNTDAIKNVRLIKGGFPARYGGRLSSVVDIRMKEGNKKEWKGEGSVGILSSKITVEGPIKKDMSSIIISGRRTYYDLLSYPIQFYSNNKSDSKTGDIFISPYFYDLNLKYNRILKNNDRIYLSAYLGKDNLHSKSNGVYNQVKSDTKFGLGWGNITASLRWNHIFNDKLFSNLTAVLSDYTFKTNAEEHHIKEDNSILSSLKVDYYSRIRDYGIKYDFDWPLNNKNYIRFGISNTLHTFSPGVGGYQTGSDLGGWAIDTAAGEKNIPGNELYVYFEDDIKFTPRLKTNIGGHFSMFMIKGKTYFSPEPRISIRYLITRKLSIKASYVRMTQYINLLTNSTSGLPTDLWVPSSQKLRPQKTWQSAIGLAYNLSDNYSVTLESYYKEMQNLVEYAEGAGFYSLGFSIVDDIATQGKGKSYGVELMAEKKSGKLRGWISYTLSKSDRTFEEISYGRTFPFAYDRRHVFSAIATYDISDRISLSSGWVYYTGQAFTLCDEIASSAHNAENELPVVSGLYSFRLGEDHYFDYPLKQTNKYFKTRNNYRMPDYHRLDIGVNFTKQKKRALRTWSLGAYNVYFRQNPFLIVEDSSDFELDIFSQNNDQNSLTKIAIFPFVPYFRYSLKF